MLKKSQENINKIVNIDITKITQKITKRNVLETIGMTGF